MAVVVQCFHCNAVLELDDGFRGGVCRCSACGSLLQVPRGDPADRPARPARPASPPAPSTAGPAHLNGAGSPQATAPTAEPGVASSGRLDPTRNPDLGGISSGLGGRVHQTRPISHVSRKAGTKEPAKPDAPSQRAAASRPKEESKPSTPEPAPARPRAPLWLTLLLLVATAAVGGIVGYVFIFHLMR